jgi:hypothetical protein
LLLFYAAEFGRNGYPGPKGQRGENGVQGPNVKDENVFVFFVSNDVIYYLDFWP